MKRDDLGGFGVGRQPGLLDCGFRQPIVPHRAGVELHHRQIAVARDGGDLVVGAASLGEHDGGVLAQPMRDQLWAVVPVPDLPTVLSHAGVARAPSSGSPDTPEVLRQPELLHSVQDYTAIARKL